MKHLLAAALIAATPAVADAPDWQADLCTAMSATAGNIMLYRQSSGATIVEAFRRIDGLGLDNDTVVGLARDLAVAAFEQPFYRTQRAKDEAVADFINSTFLACMVAG